jgi:hypothetical protein
MTVKRDKDGDIMLGDSVEVRQTFVPVDTKQEKAEGESKPSNEIVDAMIEIANDDSAPEYQKVEKAEEKKSLWAGLVA